MLNDSNAIADGDAGSQRDDCDFGEAAKEVGQGVLRGRFRLYPYMLQVACQLCMFNHFNRLGREVRNASVALWCNGLRTWPNLLK